MFRVEPALYESGYVAWGGTAGFFHCDRLSFDIERYEARGSKGIPGFRIRSSQVKHYPGLCQLVDRAGFYPCHAAIAKNNLFHRGRLLGNNLRYYDLNCLHGKTSIALPPGRPADACPSS